MRKVYLFDNPAEIPDRTPPSKILLVRFGRNKLTKGDERLELEFSGKDADLIMQDFAERGKDLVIDYEHQTEIKGEIAPAAGWIDALEKTDEGLVANVKYWTDSATERLTKGEYRYMSPVLTMSRRNKSIHSVALTNKPALHGFPALVADDDGAQALEDDEDKENQATELKNQEEKMENLRKIASGLGIQPEGKDEAGLVDAIQTNIRSLNDRNTEMVRKVEGMVSMSDLEAVKEELKKEKAAHAVEMAGLGEELKPHAIKLAMTDMDAFNALVEISKKRSAPAGNVDANVSSANPEVKLVMSDCGSKDGKNKKAYTDAERAILRKMHPEAKIKEMEEAL